MTSKHLCAEIGALQKEIQVGLEDLQSTIAQTNLKAQKSTGQQKLKVEQYIEILEQDAETQKRLIANTKDIVINMHAEFESECMKKIERLANAVQDPSSWDVEIPE